MTLTLIRDQFRKDGILSTLRAEDASVIAITLEHAYSNNAKWQPKLPNGTYTCKRGAHRLHGMTSDFETFEVIKVKGHSGILFHKGNYNKDSEGCILLGKQTFESDSGIMVTSSKITFNKFINMLKGIDSFTLLVK